MTSGAAGVRAVPQWTQNSSPAPQAWQQWGQKWPGGHECEFALALALVYLSLLGFMLALRRLIQEFTPASPGAGDLLPALAVSILPVFFRAGTHFVYDFPALFLFTLLLRLLWRRSWSWFYPVYVLALFIKETAAPAA